MLKRERRETEKNADNEERGLLRKTSRIGRGTVGGGRGLALDLRFP